MSCKVFQVRDFFRSGHFLLDKQKVVYRLSIRGPFCDPHMVLLWSILHIDKHKTVKLISKFSANPDIKFVSYAQYTLSLHWPVWLIFSMWTFGFTNIFWGEGGRKRCIEALDNKMHLWWKTCFVFFVESIHFSSQKWSMFCVIIFIFAFFFCVKIYLSSSIVNIFECKYRRKIVRLKTSSCKQRKFLWTINSILVL